MAIFGSECSYFEFVTLISSPTAQGRKARQIRNRARPSRSYIIFPSKQDPVYDCVLNKKMDSLYGVEAVSGTSKSCKVEAGKGPGN